MVAFIHAMSSASTNSSAPLDGSDFRTTHWSLILLAGGSAESRAKDALECLCRAYWPPLYAYVRRQGHSPHDAQDLTQEFFARLLEKNYIQLADPERGRFRSFLLKSLKHFLVNEWARGQAQKRGGGQRVFSLDEEAAERIYQQEPVGQVPPESLYDKRWAMTLLERAMERLGADYAKAGKQVLFDQLRPLLVAEASNDTYRELATSLGMSEGAVKVALHRLRHRFRDTVREEVGETVASPADVDEELRCLMSSMNA
jgi:RNA polymerase sigma factor (sigma-70 family)